MISGRRWFCFFRGEGRVLAPTADYSSGVTAQDARWLSAAQSPHPLPMGWYEPNRSYVCRTPLSVHESMPRPPLKGPPSRTRTEPVALSSSTPSLPCEGNEVDSGGEGGRGANFELVVVAGRGQVVVARVALRREVGTR